MCGVEKVCTKAISASRDLKLLWEKPVAINFSSFPAHIYKTWHSFMFFLLFLALSWEQISIGLRANSLCNDAWYNRTAFDR